ncbi:isocitrate lyase/phosphoenolpyruvate mutase family protein [Micromonospora sp. NPDC005599]|uniref:isocitrate lyase/phosphoenolpyruvate mutase family protein n=1 Tax=unclassified Micromonospora TaxID=2617518 RepID=UPI0033AA7D89
MPAGGSNSIRRFAAAAAAIRPDDSNADSNELAVPLNVMAGPGSPSISELAGLGVTRVSLGPAIALTAYAAARRAARELLAAGTYQALDGALGFAETDALMAAQA